MTKNKTTSIPVKFDIRGFLRVQKIVAKATKLTLTPYADIYIDRANKRIGIEFSKKLKETSFRVLPNTASELVYLKGAMNAIGINIEPGAYDLQLEKNMLIYSADKKSNKKSTWELFPCRNSAGMTMLSIDTRGTLILNKKTCDLLNTAKNNTFIAEYNAKNKTFKLTFSKNGYQNVRTIASHANASFMGTLSSNGLALPKEHLRTTCTIKENVLTFSVAKINSKQTK